jgi:3D (Asp-Asp-Asp) domain-containing protein
MKPGLKCPKWGRNLLIILTTIGILFGISLPGTLKAPRAEADLAEISDQKDLGELAIIEGNSLLPVSEPTNPEPQPVRRIKVVVTGYSSTPWETDGDPYLTAAGTRVRDGIVANNFFPIGTKIRIPELFGDKIFVVEDRMSWTKGNYQIDIWFPDYWQALNFGAKRTYIEILEG